MKHLTLSKSPVHTKLEKFEIIQLLAILDFCLKGKLDQGNHDVTGFEKRRFQLFSIHSKTQSRRFEITLP